MGASSDQSGGSSNWWFGGALFIVLLLVAFCSQKRDDALSQNLLSDSSADAGNVLNTAEAANEPLPLDKSAMIKGARQMQMVARLDLAGASQLYSLNCYDALAKTFDWHQLDRCGEFDALAVRLADQDPDLTEAELNYFQPETAATRFLGAATGHGLPNSDADVRWAALQEGAEAFRLPASAAVEANDAAANGSVPAANSTDAATASTDVDENSD